MNTPVCPYASKCGGCLYLDMPFESYVEKKKNFIINSFSHAGILLELNDFIIIPFGKRRRATFAFKKGVVGFNETKSHQIIPMDKCPALTQNLSSLLPKLKELTLLIGKKGDISLLETAQGVDIHIKTGKEQPSLDLRMTLAEFASDEQIVRLSYNFEPIVQKAPLSLPIDAFLQPSFEGEQALVNLVLTHLKGEKKVVDLFAGAGTFTTPMIKAGFEAIGYDSAKESIKLLGQHGVFRDLFRNPLTAQELNVFDCIVMDPPRAGAKEQTREISKSQVKKIIMISCNPVTAARDSLTLMNAGWKITKAIGVDQFIYTNHCEVFCLFEKE